MTATDTDGIVHLWVTQDRLRCSTPCMVVRDSVARYLTCLACIGHAAAIEQLVARMREMEKTPYVATIRI